MDAAFVDVGLDQPGFLHASDARRLRPLETLRAGERILVQVAKEGVGTKGVRLTPNVALPGRRLVHLPLVDHVGLSHRLADDAERERLERLVDRLRPPGTGWIVRTEAAGASEEDLRDEIEALAALWASIRARAERPAAPRLVWRDLGGAGRAVRDLAGAGVGRIVVDSDALEAEARAAAEEAGLGVPIERWEGPRPLWEARGIDAAVERALLPRVDLPSGGTLVVHETEAATLVDVNSGSHVAATSPETIRAVNLEAAAAIAREMRLRNLGGVVLADFIDMESEEDRGEVLERLRAATDRDPVRVFVVGWTALGYAEMTRKRVRRPLSESLQTSCPACGGLGRVRRPADTL